MALKTDWKDYIPPASGRVYRPTYNTDGTMSLVDVTEYQQVGDQFGAADINAIDTQLNALAKLSPSAYSTDGITFVGCTHADGGYVQIGHLIVINMRVVPTAAGSGLTIATGLPTPISGTTVYVCGIARIGNAASSCYVNAGALTVDGAIAAGGAVSVFAVYFAA